MRCVLCRACRSEFGVRVWCVLCRSCRSAMRAGVWCVLCRAYPSATRFRMWCVLCRACRSEFGVRVDSVWCVLCRVCPSVMRVGVWLGFVFGVMCRTCLSMMRICVHCVLCLVCRSVMRVGVRRCLIAARRLPPPCLIGAFRRLRCVDVTAEYVRSSRRCAYDTQNVLSCVPNVSIFGAVWLRRSVSPHSDNAKASLAASQVLTYCQALVLPSPPTARVALTERCDPLRCAVGARNDPWCWWLKLVQRVPYPRVDD
jgi:hypothetical protein